MLRKAFLLWPGEKGTLSLRRQSHGEEDVPGVGLGFLPRDQDTVGGAVVQRHMSSFLEDRKRILTLLRASHIHFLILEL